MSNIARFSSRPKSSYVVALKQILKYIKGTIGNCITYTRGSTLHRLIAYCDADFSIWSRWTEILLWLPSSIKWWSHCMGQPKANVYLCKYHKIWICRSLFSYTRTLWTRRLLESIQSPQLVPTTLFYNNQAAVRLIINHVFQQRTKHIDIKYHKIRDAQHDREIMIIYISTEDQLANLFTKPLARDRFN